MCQALRVIDRLIRSQQQKPFTHSKQRRAKKSALSDERLLGYDAEGRVLLRWKPSGETQWQVAALEPLELIRRWLLHVLPKGLVPGLTHLISL